MATPDFFGSADNKRFQLASFWGSPAVSPVLRRVGVDLLRKSLPEAEDVQKLPPADWVLCSKGLTLPLGRRHRNSGHLELGCSLRD